MSNGIPKDMPAPQMPQAAATPATPQPTVKPSITPTPPTTPSAVGAKPPGKPMTAPAPLTPVKKLPFRIESSHERGKYLKLMVYADYGVGKTYLMGTSCAIPSMRDVLMVNCEAGDLTLTGDDYPFHLIDSVRVRDYAQLGQIHEFLKLHCRLREEGNLDKLREVEARLKEVDVDDIVEPRQYRTVILDSLTEAEQYCMYQLLGIDIEKTRIDEESSAPEWAEYRRNHMMVQRLVRRFRDLEMNVLFTCSRAYIQDEAKRFNYAPNMTGKLANVVQGFVDMVGYMVSQAVASPDEASEKTMARRMYVQPVGRFAAKCRFSAFKGTYFDNPTMGSITKAIGLQPKDNANKK